MQNGRGHCGSVFCFFGHLSVIGRIFLASSLGRSDRQKLLIFLAFFVLYGV